MRRIITFATLFTTLLLAATSAAYATDATGMDINEFQKKMNVGDTQTISVVLTPADADSVIAYASSSPSVASISAGGKIEAHKKGKTIITVKAGKLSRKLNLEVVVKTEAITVGSTYIVLRKGEKYDLDADVTPKKADQSLKYSSSNTDVATVSKDGIVRGVSDGSASVAVSNEDAAISVAVVVNHGQTGGGVNYYDEEIDAGSNKEATKDKKEDSASAIIRKAEVQGYAGEDVLKALKDTGDTLLLKNENYDIILKGDDIVNCENPLSGNTAIRYTKEGIEIGINDEKPLPGKVTIELNESLKDKANYLYIWEGKADGYAFLGEVKAGKAIIDVPGRYLLAEKKIIRMKIDPVIPVASGTVLVFLIAVYVAVRRRYWFW